MGLFGKNWNPEGKHCYVTGGSAGLGLEVAKVLASKGANISIVARSKETLQDAVKELEKLRVSPEQQFHWYSHSLTELKGAQEALDDVCAPYGGRVPDAAFLVAGSSFPNFVVDETEESMKKGMNFTYWLQAWTAFELVQRIARQQVKNGKIVFVGSTLSYMSFAGYASYAPGKHAVRGLADTLRHEMMLYDWEVHFFVAPTMKSPGYQTEMMTKPKVCKEIEGDEGHPIDQVAKHMIKGVQKGDCHIAYDQDSNFFRVSTRGIAPHHDNFIWEIILMCIAWIGIPIWRWGIDKRIKNHREEHHQYLIEKGYTTK